MPGPIKVVLQDIPSNRVGRISFPVNFISHLENRGADTIQVGLGTSIDSPDVFPLDAGEVWEDVVIPGGVDYIVARSDSGSQELLAVGTRRTDLEAHVGMQRALDRMSEQLEGVAKRLEPVPEMRDAIADFVEAMQESGRQ